MMPASVLRLLAPYRQQAAVQAETQLCVPLPVIRRVAFASVAGGAGSSTACVRAAAVIAGRRGERTLLVDATAAERREAPLTSARVDHAAVPVPVWPSGIAAWRQACDRAHRDYEMTLTDWGKLLVQQLAAVAEHSHLVCLATALERTAVQRALDAAAFVQQSGTPVLLIGAALRGRASIAAHRMLAQAPVPSLLLRHERRLLRSASRVGTPKPSIADLQLGAAVVQLSTGFSEAIAA